MDIKNEKEDITRMIKQIDMMRETNHKRVIEISEKLESFVLADFNPEEVQWLNTNECKSWVYRQIGEDSYGQFGWMSKYGFGLQNIGHGRLKCISMYDDPPAIYNLAWLKFAVESVGGSVELGDYTILRMPQIYVKDMMMDFFLDSAQILAN